MTEPTATNPQTGEKLVFRGGQWQPMGAAPAAPTAPGVIYGRPKVAPPPTAIQLEDQAMQREGLELSRQSNERAANAEQRAQAEFTGQGGTGTVDEKKIATLVTRVAGGLNDIKGVLATDPEAARPGLVEGLRGDLSPGGIGGLVTRAIAGPDRRAVNDSQRDMLDALLTLGTGAAYAPEQLRAAVSAHFPQYGDSEDEAAIKMQRLERVIEAAKANAGPAWVRVEPMIAPFMQSLSASPDGAARPTDEDEGLTGVVSYEGPNPANGGGGDRFFGQFGEFMDDAGTIGKQGLSLGLSDEAAGIGGAISSVLKGGSAADGYTRERDIERARIEAARGRMGWGGTALEIAAGGGAGKITNALSSVASAARQGAGFGALGGFGYGEGVASVPNAALGGVLGGGIGAIAQKGANALASRRAPAAGPDPEQIALLEAAQRQGVPLRQPDVRPELRGNFAAAEQTATGGPRIRAAIADDRASVEQGVRGVAPGTARDEFALGNTTQAAAKRTASTMKTRVDALYTRARAKSGGAVVAPTRTISAIDDRIAALQQSGESANSAEVSVLQGIKSDLSKSGLTIDSLQAQRKTLRDRISQSGMDPDRAEAGFIELMKEAANELTEGLPDGAKGALRTAEAAYIERRKFQDEIAKQFLGTRNNPIPPERAANRFLSMVKSKGDYNRFSRMFGELDDAERGDFAATIAEGLGTKTNGEFEYGKFLRDLEQVNPRALRDVFGKDGIAALNDLRVIARAKSDTLAEKNSSRTGGVVERVGSRLQGVILTAFGAGAGGVPGAVAGGMASGTLERFSSQRAARLLLNPDFTKWLRQTPSSTSPQVINRHFERLNRIAARSGTQSLQSDARALQEHLTRAFSQSPSLAASEGQQEQNGR